MNYKRFPVGALWTNCYLFWDDNTHQAFCVDPGGDTADIRNFLAAQSLKLSMILLTHGHIDHTAGILELVPYAGNNIYISSQDAPSLRKPETDLQALLDVHFAGIADFKEVNDGDVIDFPGCTITVISTPGHTPGSVCYSVTDTENHSVLLSGDTLFAQSVGRTDLQGGDDQQLTASLRKLALLPDSLHVLPGHGPDTYIASEREMNPYWPN